MVLIEENNGTATNANEASNKSTPSASASASSANNTTSSAGPQQTTGGLIDFLMRDKISLALFATRVLTLFFSFLFIVPISGSDSATLYTKALMASAATSALKLHQRVSTVPFQLSRAYFGSLMIEDSFHYLLYALIFMNSFPITVVLMPVAAFALLHVSAYAKNLLNYSGSALAFLRSPVNLICSRDKDIMRFVAVTEIILGPTIIFMIFSGKAGIFVPFIYYRFICMRYQSRRNPYSRLMFYELRVTLEQYASQPNCPQILRNLIQRFVGLCIRMAPQPNTI